MLVLNLVRNRGPHRVRPSLITPLDGPASEESLHSRQP